MTWGLNGLGQLGHGDCEERKDPTVVDALAEEQVIDFDLGLNFTVAITQRGNVFFWGLLCTTQSYLLPQKLSVDGVRGVAIYPSSINTEGTSFSPS